MSESEFWVHLEFRLCHEFSGLPQRRHRHLWCDGIEPEEYELDGPRPMIRGRAVIYGSEHSGYWAFRLILPRAVADRDSINWDELLPPRNMTRWMSFSEEEQWIEIEPGVAVPDLEPG